MSLPQEATYDPTPPPPTPGNPGPIPPVGRPRTAAEQADFEARVQALADAKRIEAEQSEVEAAAAARHEERQKEIEQNAENDARVAAERQKEAEAQTALAAHPHTRLTALQTQMRAPNLDVNARIGMLTSVVSQLVQIIKEHTPAPESNDGQERIEQQPVEGTDGQVGVGL
jgi:hypothetical protein